MFYALFEYIEKDLVVWNITDEFPYEKFESDHLLHDLIKLCNEYLLEI